MRESYGRPVSATRDPAVPSRQLAGGQPDRRHSASRDRGRCAAGRRGVSRARLGEQPLARGLRRRVRVPRRAGRAAPRPHTGPMGRRRAAGDLLLRRRPGAQTGVRRRRPAEPSPRRAARRRRGRRHGAPGAGVHRGQRPRRRGTSPAGRSRPRPTSPSPWPCSPSSAPRCPPHCARSCSPWPSSTTCSRSRSSRSSTPRTCTCCRWRWPRCRWRCSPCSCSAASAPGGSCCRSPWRPGH